MFLIDKLNNITIIEGDSGCFKLTVEDYEMIEGDKIYLSVRGREDKEYIFQKVIEEFEGNQATFVIEPKDTQGKAGRYLYDVQITLKNGYVDTVIQPTKFTIKGGITNE